MASNPRNKIGAKPKSDNAIYKYSLRLNEEEKGKFDLLFSQSGVVTHTRFIKNRIFATPFRVFHIDKNSRDYFIRLTQFHHQFQAIGNNYNQTVRAIKTNFGDKRAVALLAKLEKYTLDLVVISKEIAELTREYEQKWLQK